MNKQIDAAYQEKIRREQTINKQKSNMKDTFKLIFSGIESFIENLTDGDTESIYDYFGGYISKGIKSNVSKDKIKTCFLLFRELCEEHEV